MTTRCVSSVLETLETRRLLASFASVNGNGTLSVVGTSKADTITVQISGSKVQAILNGTTESFTSSTVKRIWADAYAGNDTITNKTNLPATLVGGTGKDRLVVGSGQNELYLGDYPPSGDEILSPNVEAGDTIDYTTQQPGQYFVDVPNSYEPGTITRPNGTVDDIFTGYNVAIDVHFTSGDDQVGVSEGGGAVFDGQWRFFLGSGNDTFDAGSGIAYVDGEAGNDVISFDYDSIISTIMGGSGNDTINNASGYPATFIDAGSGYDVENLDPDEPIRDAPAEFTVPAGVEKFSMVVGVDNDLVVHGNDLDNIIDAIGGNVTVYGNGGNDQITARTSTEDDLAGGHLLLEGGDGNDVLHGSAELSSTLKGGAGNDTLIGDADVYMYDPTIHASYIYEGDSGTDTADFSGRTNNLNITLDNKANDGASGENSNVEADVENVIGGSGNDFIAGNPSNNSLEGGAGDDTIWGSSGNDTLVGDAGHDQLYGQDGNDTLIGKDGQTDTLDGGTGTDIASRDNSSSVKDQVLNIESFI